MRESLREHDVQLVSFPSSLSNYRITPCLIRCDASQYRASSLHGFPPQLSSSISFALYLQSVPKLQIFYLEFIENYRKSDNEIKRYFLSFFFIWIIIAFLAIHNYRHRVDSQNRFLNTLKLDRTIAVISVNVENYSSWIITRWFIRKEKRKGRFLTRVRQLLRANKSLVSLYIAKKKTCASFVMLDIVNQAVLMIRILRENLPRKKMSVKLWDTPWSTLSSK